MRREEVTLMMLATAEGGAFTPVQIQKAIFLLSKEAPELFGTGSVYNFQPYDYGPFDRAVYGDIEAHVRDGNAAIMSGRIRQYCATKSGIEIGQELLSGLTTDRQQFVREVSEFVRAQSFSDLVSSIYRAYPQMRENSIFVSDE